jgi:hypothetical protein
VQTKKDMANIQQIWKPIPGYEGIYEINNLGIIKSLDRYVKHCKGGKTFIKGKIVSISRHKQGHHVVRLWKENKTKLFCLYRLMAIVFIPNPENKKQVNHINGNRKSYPDLNNLEWVTASENMKHAYTNGLTNGTFKKGFEHQFCKLKESDISLLFTMRFEGKSLKDMADFFNINPGHASKVLNDKKYEYLRAK